MEQPGWPMPFANVTIGANTIFTTSGGTPGLQRRAAGTTTLAGQFVRMTDTCGAINETAAAADFDLGRQPRAPTARCPPATPPATRTSVALRLLRAEPLIEQAKGYLPANAWLQAQLTPT